MIAITNSTTNSIIISKLEQDELLNKYPELKNKELLVYTYKKAITQGIIHRVEEVEVDEIPYEELLKIKSNRGKGGWGSTGK